ncbi:hypothetical protein HYW76_04585 [Candidatus Pacearchaeota archaeon]|nr:hypothetical protein [Candidatus Pacearchaeota archaeon]
MKRVSILTISFIFILLGLSLVSASWFSDMLDFFGKNKITGRYTGIGGGVCECSNCSDCSSALQNSSCNEIRLTQDIIVAGSSPTCIVGYSYSLSNKIFDFGGHKLSSAGNFNVMYGAFYGLKFYNANNFKLKNGEISDYAGGSGAVATVNALEFEGGSNIIFENFKMRNVSGIGVHFENVTNLQIKNIQLIDTLGIYSKTGVYSEPANQNNFININNVTCISNFRDFSSCIYINKMSQSTISNIKLQNLGNKRIDSGISLGDISSNTFSNIELTGSGTGIGILMGYSADRSVFNEFNNINVNNFGVGIKLGSYGTIKLKNVTTKQNIAKGIDATNYGSLYLENINIESNNANSDYKGLYIVGYGNISSANVRSCNNNRIDIDYFVYGVNQKTYSNSTCNLVGTGTPKCDYKCDGTTFCTNDCSSGQKQCYANGYKTCGNYDSDSCLEFSGNTTLCPANQTCQNGNCTSNQQEYNRTSSCTPGTIKSGTTCLKCNAQGTSYVQNSSLCLANQTCDTGGNCLNNGSVCIPGGIYSQCLVCNSLGTFKVPDNSKCSSQFYCTESGLCRCNPGIIHNNATCLECSSNGTSFVMNISLCQNGSFCNASGMCVYSNSTNCTNECLSLNLTGCFGNGTRICGDYDSDECLEWSNVSDCLIGESCSNGICAIASEPPIYTANGAEDINININNTNHSSNTIINASSATQKTDTKKLIIRLALFFGIIFILGAIAFLVWKFMSDQQDRVKAEASNSVVIENSEESN